MLACQHVDMCLPTPHQSRHIQFTYIAGFAFQLVALSVWFDHTIDILHDIHKNDRILSACWHVGMSAYFTPHPRYIADNYRWHTYNVGMSACLYNNLFFSWKYEFNNYLNVGMSTCRHIYTHIHTMPTYPIYLFECRHFILSVCFDSTTLILQDTIMNHNIFSACRHVGML